MLGCKGRITLGAMWSHIQNKEITFCHVFVQLLLIAVDIKNVIKNIDILCCPMYAILLFSSHFDVVFEYMYRSTNHIYAPVFFCRRFDLRFITIHDRFDREKYQVIRWTLIIFTCVCFFFWPIMDENTN